MDDTKKAEKRMPEIGIKKSRCCGCGVCSFICSKSAITMQPDAEGFIYPNIDKEKCIRCYLCEKVCLFRK